MIHNPILKGFNPDPSILRAGEDYYLATSTFQWFPGVQIFHSRDLANWRLIDHGLNDTRRLNLVGVPDSGGVWAPSLSWHDGLFHLVYTVVRTGAPGRAFKDTHNYLITAESIHGPWSEPAFLNSSGFDPSLFHDDDGKKWVVNMLWDHRRQGIERFQGIILQEYDPMARRLHGPITNLLRKPILIEGPNLYKRNGWYYLMLAEGGTGFDHSTTMARSRSITGPYELDPQPQVLTAKGASSLELQKAGHGELVETQAGDWYLAHLASRPVGPERRCILGRETSIQKVVWSEDGWLRLAGGGPHPRVDVPVSLPEHPWPPRPERDDFNDRHLSPEWASLRVPVDPTWASLEERPGWLRLAGRESLFSLHDQSLLAQRLQNFRVRVETRVDFHPTNFMQSAGLICYYDTRGHYYLRVTRDEEKGRILGIVQTDEAIYQELEDAQIAIDDWGDIFLRAEIDHAKLQFFASADALEWITVGPVLDMTKLSDDYGTGFRFTGAFCGICAQDLGGTRLHADFDFFSMQHQE
jgi:xylan 1,4-beta-xylosidase